MTRRNFNWNYNTAHPLGQSHVRDQREDSLAFVREQAMLDNVTAKRRLQERQRERNEFFERNPHLLRNIHD